MKSVVILIFFGFSTLAMAQKGLTDLTGSYSKKEKIILEYLINRLDSNNGVKLKLITIPLLDSGVVQKYLDSNNSYGENAIVLLLVPNEGRAFIKLGQDLELFVDKNNQIEIQMELESSMNQNIYKATWNAITGLAYCLSNF